MIYHGRIHTKKITSNRHKCLGVGITTISTPPQKKKMKERPEEKESFQKEGKDRWIQSIHGFQEPFALSLTFHWLLCEGANTIYIYMYGRGTSPQHTLPDMSW